ncbi:MAG: TadE family type IV pilus minor pilin [Sporichthyaceae bacterium]
MLIGRERGTVTAETAVVLPALVVVLVLCLWSVTVVGQQLRCIDAARTGARALARGEASAAAGAAAQQAAPDGAIVTLRVSAGLAVVEVRYSATLPGVGGPGIQIGSRAAVATEEDVVVGDGW